jgi:alanine racemase
MVAGSTRAVAHVDLARVAGNVRTLKRRRSASTGLCAVVKADAYGHGAVPVARAALGAGAERLAVATAPEAHELRTDGISAPIIILGPVTCNEARWAAQAHVEVVVSDPELVRELSDLDLAVHVKLDTGMGRLGARNPAIASQTAELACAGRLRLVGAMTHLATADDFDPQYARDQIAAFLGWAEPLRARHPQIALHAANTAATLRLPEAHLDFVRTGIGIYGLDPFGRSPSTYGLRPALTLTSFVAMVKPLRRGESCGYGRTFRARSDTHLGIVPIGYGDGVPRALGNRGEVMIGGHRCPIVGAVSMDGLTVDLGSRPRARVGDAVTVIGPGVSAEDIARKLGTISYEIVARLGRRVQRIHAQETDVMAWPAL